MSVWYYIREGQSRRAVDGIPLGIVAGMILTVALLAISGRL